MLESIFLFMFQVMDILGERVATTINDIPNNGNVFVTLKNGTVVQYSFFSNKSEYEMFFNNLVLIIGSYFFSGFIVMFIFSHIIHRDKNYAEAVKDSDSYESDDESDEDEGEAYESQYFDKLEELEDRELSSEDLIAINGCTLTEETPKGIVHMKYNTDTLTFEYYTDKFSDMTYEILDTVARLFSITFNCKKVCVNYREEIVNGKNKMLSEIEYDKMMSEKANEEKEKEKEKERSVFASFKSYNKKSGNNLAKKYFIITENSNRFKFKGKLNDYEKLVQKQVDTVDEKTNCINISYSEYKKLQSTCKTEL